MNLGSSRCVSNDWNPRRERVKRWTLHLQSLYFQTDPLPGDGVPAFACGELVKPYDAAAHRLTVGCDQAAVRPQAHLLSPPSLAACSRGLLLIRILESYQEPVFDLVRAEMHKRGGFVLREVVQARFDDDIFFVADSHGHALRLLVDAPLHRFGFVGLR